MRGCPESIFKRSKIQSVRKHGSNANHPLIIARLVVPANTSLEANVKGVESQPTMRRRTWTCYMLIHDSTKNTQASKSYTHERLGNAAHYNWCYLKTHLSHGRNFNTLQHMARESHAILNSHPMFRSSMTHLKQPVSSQVDVSVCDLSTDKCNGLGRHTYSYRESAFKLLLYECLFNSGNVRTVGLLVLLYFCWKGVTFAHIRTRSTATARIDCIYMPSWGCQRWEWVSRKWT